MKNSQHLLLILMIPLMNHACSGNNTLVEDPESYIRSVEQWQEDRLEGLKAKDGWLNLAGIYWLEEGEPVIELELEADRSRSPSYLTHGDLAWYIMKRRIILDFNKAYNPPCAVTPFAACPMPPPENHLPVRVEAGEKSMAGH